MLCGFPDGYENLGRQRKKLGMQCFHSWLFSHESLLWATGKVLSWSDFIQTILCSCNNKFSSFQVIYFNYGMISVIDFFFLYTLRPFIAFPVQGRFKMLTSVFRDNKDFWFHPSMPLLNKAVFGKDFSRSMQGNFFFPYVDFTRTLDFCFAD